MNSNEKKENVFTNRGKALVSKIRCDRDLKQNIGQAAIAIGSFQKLVQLGDTILLKPHFNASDPLPASSDPQFVKAVTNTLSKLQVGV